MYRLPGVTSERHRDAGDDFARDIVLNSENIVELAFDPDGGKQRTLACGVDETGDDLDAVAGLLHAAFHDHLDVETFADLPNRFFHHAACRSSRGESDVPNGAQPAADVLSQSVPEMLDVRTTRTDDLKREDGG